VGNFGIFYGGCEGLCILVVDNFMTELEAESHRIWSKLGCNHYFVGRI
jgi:hypothetical protein